MRVLGADFTLLPGTLIVIKTFKIYMCIVDFICLYICTL